MNESEPMQEENRNVETDEGASGRGFVANHPTIPTFYQRMMASRDVAIGGRIAKQSVFDKVLTIGIPCCLRLKE
jgi:hypothetical protein